MNAADDDDDDYAWCRSCSAAVLESPSALAAFVRIVVTDAHRQHIEELAEPLDDLPWCASCA